MHYTCLFRQNNIHISTLISYELVAVISVFLVVLGHSVILHVSSWCYQMETFFALLALCAGNSLVTGEFPAQRPVTRSFDVFLGLRLSKRLSKQSWGWWFETLSRPSWRHCNEIGQPDPRVDPYWLILCVVCTFCKDSIKYSWLWFVVINDQCMLSFAHPLLCWCRCGSWVTSCKQ